MARADSKSFPDDSFVQQCRILEVEALEGGRRSNEFSMSPPDGLQDENSPIALTALDDVQETEERIVGLQKYVCHAQRAFEDRGLEYPFQISESGASLERLPALAAYATECARLSEMAGIGHRTAKDFELRAARALHRLIGGWGVCVGSPRSDRTGPGRAVARFRSVLRESERGPYSNPDPPHSGDFGIDGVWILGRPWGGPVVILQAKNSGFNREKLGGDYLRRSDAIQEWFGRRLDQKRAVITVFALNTVLTIEMKESAFEASGAGGGYHIIDSVDIILAEQKRDANAPGRDEFLEF